MTFSMSMTVKGKVGTKSVQARAEMLRALADVSEHIRVKAATYPPSTGGGYRRTGELGRSIRVRTRRLNQYAVSATVGTDLDRAVYTEGGTGIYGPRGVPITPVSAKVLRWNSTNRGFGRRGVAAAAGILRRGGASRSVHSGVVFAYSSRGQRGWHFMQKAFNSPETASYFRTRLAQVVAVLAAA